jgi:hypothetical protein
MTPVRASVRGMHRMSNDSDDLPAAAIRAWDAAEKAYNDEAAHYFSMGNLQPGVPVSLPERDLDDAALARVFHVIGCDTGCRCTEVPVL